MLLGDFIKELKHSSTWIELRKDTHDLDVEERDPDDVLFEGTVGVLKNNIHYQNKYSSYSIGSIQPFYDDKYKCEFVIWIYKAVLEL